MSAFIEGFPHVSGMQQGTIGAVGPMVVGAYQVAGFALLLQADPGATVAAGIVEGIDIAIGITNHDDRGLADIDGEPGACVRNIAGHAREYPAPVPDGFHFRVENGFAAVKILRQPDAGLINIQ